MMNITLIVRVRFKYYDLEKKNVGKLKADLS